MRPATIINHPVPEYNGVRVMIGDPFKPGDRIFGLASNPKVYRHVDNRDGVSYPSDTAFMHVSAINGETVMLYMVEHAWLVKPKGKQVEAKQLEVVT